MTGPGSKPGLIAGARDFFARTLRHPVGFIGVNLTSIAGVLFVILTLMETTGRKVNPYLGILTFFLLPAIFILGLVLMPIGRYLDRKRQLRAGLTQDAFPVLDLNTASTRSRFVFIVVMTLVNVCIVGLAAYKGVEHMDTPEFCGKTCHNIMQPEFTAHSNSPHQRVPCVDCHVGAGADAYVNAKMNGLKQVMHTVLRDYPRPVPTPVHNLRPARETCEHCHWPTKFVGDRMVVRTHYEDDEVNSALKSVLLLKIGGGGSEAHTGRGIHWHVANPVEYRSDESREHIYWVRGRSSDGTVREFWQSNLRESEALPDSIEKIAPRTMDCVDCHNRPTHIYRMPGDAVDQAMNDGEIPSDLPFFHREAVSALTAEYADGPAALAGIDKALRAFYSEQVPDLATSRAADLDRAVAGVQAIYSKNVFPPMNVGWGTYPDHIGHRNFPGCFRCHDEDHTTAEGETISQDCSTCHSLLAVEEPDPEILKNLFPEQ
ncbi:MAG: NapC/NirT family cytochrome c [Candidatus Eisenbacteria bacterium]